MRLVAVAAGLIFICLSAQPAAANLWYVDNSVGSNGAGTSWASPWKDFTNIVWGGAGVNPGDTVYISGGSTSQTYTDQINPTAGGSSGNPITITAGIDAGHNGQVIIDVASVPGVFNVEFICGTCIDFVVQNLTLQNPGDAAVLVNSTSAGLVTVQNLTIHTGAGPTNGTAWGIRVQGNTGAVNVLNNTIDTPATTTTAASTAAISLQANTGLVTISGNQLLESNASNGQGGGGAGNDCITTYRTGNTTITGNFCSHVNGGANNLGFNIIDMVSGTNALVSNNVIYMPVGDAISNSFLTESGFTGTLSYYNNTTYGSGSSYLMSITAVGATLDNNIFYQAGTGTGVFTSVSLTSDYNLIYAPSGVVANISGVNKTWATWQAAGNDTHGVNANPVFTTISNSANGFALQATSPALNVGTTLSQVPTDYLGTTRPQGTAYDLGAFERIGGGGGGGSNASGAFLLFGLGGGGASGAPTIPVNTALPVVSSSFPVAGTAETTTNGTWTHSPTSYTYQWRYGGGANISGATASSYTPVAGSANTIFSKALTGSASGWSNYNFAVTIPPADLTADTTDNQVRVTINFNASNSATTLDDLWICEQGTGNAYNCDGSQVQLKFSGATSLSGIGASAIVVSDFANFTYSAAKTLVVRLHVSGANPWLNQQGSTSENYYYLGGSSQSGITNPTGTWTLEAGLIIGVAKIEMQKPGDVGQTLQSMVTAINGAGSSSPAISTATNAVAATGSCANIPGTSTPVGAGCILSSSFPTLTSPVDPRVTYGADPTGATNSGPAFQNAANATGHDIHITCPTSAPCTYMVSDASAIPPVNITRNVNIQCDSNVTLFSPDHDAQYSAILYFANVTGGGVYGCNFLGANAGSGPLHFDPTLWGGYLLIAVDSSGLLFEGNTFGNTWSDAALDLSYHGGTAVTNTTVQFNTFTANPVYGLGIIAGGNITVQNNLAIDSLVGVESDLGYPMTGHISITKNQETYINGGCNAAGDSGCNFVVGFTGGQIVDGFTTGTYSGYGTNTVTTNYVAGSNANGAAGIMNFAASYISPPPTYSGNVLGPGGVCQNGGVTC